MNLFLILFCISAYNDYLTQDDYFSIKIKLIVFIISIIPIYFSLINLLRYQNLIIKYIIHQTIEQFIPSYYELLKSYNKAYYRQHGYSSSFMFCTETGSIEEIKKEDINNSLFYSYKNYTKLNNNVTIDDDYIYISIRDKSKQIMISEATVIYDEREYLIINGDELEENIKDKKGFIKILKNQNDYFVTDGYFTFIFHVEKDIELIFERYREILENNNDMYLLIRRSHMFSHGIIHKMNKFEKIVYSSKYENLNINKINKDDYSSTNKIYIIIIAILSIPLLFIYLLCLIPFLLSILLIILSLIPETIFYILSKFINVSNGYFIVSPFKYLKFTYEVLINIGYLVYPNNTIVDCIDYKIT